MSDPAGGGTRPPVDVFFWVQHLLGIGHLTRAATLVRAMRRAGMRVTLVSGGMPVQGLALDGAELLQLAPVRSDGIDFRTLLDGSGRPVDAAFEAARRDALLAAFAARRPLVLMTEMFPFGRRRMRFELAPLLEAARQALPRPWLVASVRDILVGPPKAERAAEMLHWARAFDRLLVHGDPALVPFASTFPRHAELGDRLVETGYVVDLPANGVGGEDAGAGGDGQGEIMVSAGGGRVGERLLAVALEAACRAAAAGATWRWRVLVGQELPEAGFRALVATAAPGVVVERARPDFPALLARAALSISQGGYNTVTELLAAGCPAVVVPFAAGGENEQMLRCRLLAERGLIAVLDEAVLDAPGLVAAVQRQLATPRPTEGARPRLDGIERTVRLLSEMLAQPDTRNRL